MNSRQADPEDPSKVRTNRPGGAASLVALQRLGRRSRRDGSSVRPDRADKCHPRSMNKRGFRGRWRSAVTRGGHDRTTPHQPPPGVHNRATIEWADGPEFRGTSARLTDISQAGVGFVADHPPPPDRAVWLRLESPRATGWVSARVVRRGDSTVGGLCFSGYCPYDLIGSLT